MRKPLETMIMKYFVLRFFCAFLVAGMSIANAAAGDSYPSKPVKIIVPYPPGGAYDIIARVVGQKLSSAWGQPFLVENRTGANGALGAVAVAKAPPDGYTLMVGGLGPNAINGSLYPNLSYDPAEDFAPIVQVINTPNVLVVNPAFKPRSVAEVVALGRSGAEKLVYASAGAGSSTHLVAAMFGQAAKVELLQIPYRGDGPAATAVMAGETPMYFPAALSVLPYVKSGRVRALAVTGSHRLRAFPNVPTMSESGLPGFQATAWYGFFAPKDTPAELIEKLNKQINIILNETDVRQTLEGDGAAEIVGGSTKAFSTLVKSDTAKWKSVIKLGNIVAE